MRNFDSYYDQGINNYLYKSSIQEQHEWHECQGMLYMETLYFPEDDYIPNEIDDMPTDITTDDIDNIYHEDSEF